MPIVETLLGWAAIVVGFISAWLWYRASGALVLKGDPRSRGGFLTGTKDGTQVDVYSTVVEVARLNKHAAIATAVAVSSASFGSVIQQIGLASVESDGLQTHTEIAVAKALASSSERFRRLFLEIRMVVAVVGLLAPVIATTFPAIHVLSLRRMLASARRRRTRARDFVEAA